MGELPGDLLLAGAGMEIEGGRRGEEEVDVRYAGALNLEG